MDEKGISATKKASRRWREDKDKHAFSLTATADACKPKWLDLFSERSAELGKSGLLFRGHDADNDGIEEDDQMRIMPHTGSFTIWDTIPGHHR